MPINLREMLVVGVSSGALFDTRQEEALLAQGGGLEAFIDSRLKTESEILGPGTAFAFVKGLLRLNDMSPDKQLVEVFIVSKNNPRASLRVTNSIEHHGFNISRLAFTGGTTPLKYLQAFNVSLFLSRDEDDVKEAIEHGIAAGLVYDPPNGHAPDAQQLRIAFDGDAVIFSDEAEKIYKSQKLHGFHAHEKEKALIPLPPGPFANFLRLIVELQKTPSILAASGIPPIRTGLITSRNMPSHKRALKTLESWGVEVNEAYFLGGVDKLETIRAFNPHIFFDDQHLHVGPASSVVPCVLVPCETTRVAAPRQERHHIAEVLPVERLESLAEVSADRMSKADFARKCRSIFAPYMPMQKGKLDRVYREFIAAGSRKTPEQRWKISQELDRYNLAELTDHDPSLNRENPLLARKLGKLLGGADSKAIQGDFFS